MCRIGLRKDMILGGISRNAQGFEFERSLRRMKLYGCWAADACSGCPGQDAQLLWSRCVRGRG